MIREELGAAKSGDHTRPSAGEPNHATPELLAQRRDAAEAVDALVSGGVWDSAQRRSLREKLPSLDPEQVELALQKLATGINSGEIQLSLNGAPL
jgi:hypothetical protein